MGKRYQRALAYRAMKPASMERWKLFIPVSFLLHLIIFLSIDIKRSMPVPNPKLNKPITLVLQPRSIPTPTIVQRQPEKTTLPAPRPVRTPAPVVAKKIPRPVAAKIPPPSNEARHRYVKAPPIQHATVAKTKPPVPVKRSKPVQQPRVAQSNIPDNMAQIRSIGIPIQAAPQTQQPVIMSKMASDMDHPTSIGIPMQTTAPVQPSQIATTPAPVVPKANKPSTRVQMPAPVQPVQKNIQAVPTRQRIANAPKPEVPIPAPPIKQTPIEIIQPAVPDNTVEQSAFQQRLETLQENVVTIIPVFPQVIRLIAQGWLKELEEIAMPTPARVPYPEVKQNAQESEVHQPKNTEAIPEQFMTDDRWHTKEVIQGNMDKDSLQAEQQGKSGKKLSSIIFKEHKNYGDVTEQENTGSQNTKKRKGVDFGIPIGDCYLGSKAEEEDDGHKNHLNCNY